MAANDDAAECNSLAKPSQAVAASNIDAGPAPENINNELISGGSTEKFITPVRLSVGELGAPTAPPNAAAA
jgi:hypothetical protein